MTIFFNCDPNTIIFLYHITASSFRNGRNTEVFKKIFIFYLRYRFLVTPTKIRLNSINVPKEKQKEL